MVVWREDRKSVVVREKHESADLLQVCTACLILPPPQLLASAKFLFYFFCGFRSFSFAVFTSFTLTIAVLSKRHKLDDR